MGQNSKEELENGDEKEPEETAARHRDEAATADSPWPVNSAAEVP
jgi:hypothetical protein